MGFARGCLYNQFQTGSKCFHGKQINVNRQVSYTPWNAYSNQLAQGMLNTAQSIQNINEIIFVAGRPIGSGWLGVSLVPVDRGLLITDLIQNSPASIGGLNTGDIITGCNGRKINNINI